LFVEKEGFLPILQAANIGERFDIAVMSTKGLSVTAARRLVEELTRRGVTILTAHDFDFAGLCNHHTLCHDTRRYAFTIKPKVIDLGLRLNDVTGMKLQSEPFTFHQAKDPREKLRIYGASRAEFEFLVRSRGYREWHGQRVELNAMTSDRFIQWLEDKFAKHGVTKVVPEKATLDIAWRRACMIAKVRKAIDAFKAETDSAVVPKGVTKRLHEMLADSEMSWDEALATIATETEDN
jgi:hypothetical protein